MKKIISLLTVFSLSLTLIGCSDDNDSEMESPFALPGTEVSEKMLEDAFKTSAGAMGNLAKEGHETAEQRLAERKSKYNQKKVTVNDVITTDSATIKLKSYAILENEYSLDNEKNIILTFDYTNTDDTEWHFYTALGDVYQGGVHIPRALDTLEKENTTSIRQGTTLEVVTSYTIRNESDSFELIFHNMHPTSGDDVEIVYTLEL